MIINQLKLERMRDYTIDGLPRLNRRYIAYKNSPLPTIEDKLLFILVHIKKSRATSSA